MQTDGPTHIADLFGNHRLARVTTTRTRRTERGDLYDIFLREINPSRVSNGYQPLTHARLGYLLEKIKTADLYALDKRCREADSYSKMFWWSINPKSARPVDN